MFSDVVAPFVGTANILMSRALPQLPGYEIQSRLGEGAGATISLGIEKATLKRVAIKQVIGDDPEAEKFVQQAENEYEIAHKINHPVLRKYYDIVRIKKWFKTREVFLIMEYVDGVRLEDQIPERLEDAIRIFIEVAEGLHAMHTAGFVHADIKPNNIMLCPAGRVKIIDFGQSCPLGHQKERIQGTPDYMAPEQINRHPLDHRTDIFNLGCTMYQVFTGKYFTTLMSVAEPGTPKQQLDSTRASEPPHELNDKLPLALSKLIMECCETAPTDRPRDMRLVISRLQTALHAIETRGEKPAKRPRRDSGAGGGGAAGASTSSGANIATLSAAGAPGDDGEDDSFWSDLGLELDSEHGSLESS